MSAWDRCRRRIEIVDLALPLALSPLAGRGDEACSPDHTRQRIGTSEREQDISAFSFSPPAGRRWRQPDEGSSPCV
ncbi:hypothetical protein E5176_16710 [Ensifer adhaerens]|nr:hypothetical protein E5176_16710 [Ensifer adhaerens]